VISDPAAYVTFAQHLGQVFLGATRGAVDSAVVLAPLPGLALAAEEDADEPAAPAAGYDLSDVQSAYQKLVDLGLSSRTVRYTHSFCAPPCARQSAGGYSFTR
jgi:hypothetical protein